MKPPAILMILGLALIGIAALHGPQPIGVSTLPPETGAWAHISHASTQWVSNLEQSLDL